MNIRRSRLIRVTISLPSGTIINHPNPKQTQVCYSILPKHTEELSYARHCARHWGEGWEYNREELNNSLFLRHKWERQTYVHSANTRAGRSPSWCWDKLRRGRVGEKWMPSGSPVKSLGGVCFYINLKGWYYGKESCREKGTIFCKSGHLEWKEQINWKLKLEKWAKTTFCSILTIRLIFMLGSNMERGCKLRHWHSNELELWLFLWSKMWPWKIFYLWTSVSPL